MIRPRDDTRPGPPFVTGTKARTDPGRMAPRGAVQRRTLLRRRGGPIIQTLSRDISIGGLGLRCDPATAYLIHFDGEVIADRAPLFEVSLALPLAEDLHALRALSRLLYRVPGSTGTVAVGLRFVDLDENTLELVQTFVHAAARGRG